MSEKLYLVHIDHSTFRPKVYGSFVPSPESPDLLAFVPVPELRVGMMCFDLGQYVITAPPRPGTMKPERNPACHVEECDEWHELGAEVTDLETGAAYRCTVGVNLVCRFNHMM